MRSIGLTLHYKISDLPMGGDSRLKQRVNTAWVIDGDDYSLCNTVETVIGIVSAQPV